MGTNLNLVLCGVVLAVIASVLVWLLVRRGTSGRTGKTGSQKRPEARSQRPVLPRRENALSELQVRAALRVDADNPLWVAVHQLIEQQVEEAKWQVADAENQLRPQLLSFYAGGINVLERLRAFLTEERERALSEVEDE